jgi:hypothetical protein
MPHFVELDRFVISSLTLLFAKGEGRFGIAETG